MNTKSRIGNNYSVSNAGAILMHPFLPTLFTELNLTKNNLFIDDKRQEKAIWLLYYMVTGHLEFDESQVALLKLICDQDIHSSLKYKPELSKKEKNEVITVIESAIKHWTVLKDNSFEFFRNTFLLRNGILNIHESYAELNVEKYSVDILMNSLPWSLSLFKLPWSDRGFQVNWA